MENKPKKQRSYLNLFIRRLLSMKEDKAPEEETIALSLIHISEPTRP